MFDCGDIDIDFVEFSLRLLAVCDLSVVPTKSLIAAYPRRQRIFMTDSIVDTLYLWHEISAKILKTFQILYIVEGK